MTDPCRILIVEDHDDVADLLATYLSTEGYHIRTAANGPAMGAALDAEVFDAVVLDMTLPGGESGWALAERVRERKIGLILVTGDHRHVADLEESGLPHLTKPFKLDAFRRMVEKVLSDVEADCAPDSND